MRYLGIDYGEKHIGLALGIKENDIKVAVPYKVLERKDDLTLIQTLVSIIKEEKIEKIVVGIPRMGRVFGEQQKKNSMFADFLVREIPSLPVIRTDESFSSLQAQKRMKELGIKDSSDHALAATLVLQGYLDALE